MMFTQFLSGVVIFTAITAATYMAQAYKTKQARKISARDAEKLAGNPPPSAFTRGSIVVSIFIIMIISLYNYNIEKTNHQKYERRVERLNAVQQRLTHWEFKLEEQKKSEVDATQSRRANMGWFRRQIDRASSPLRGSNEEVAEALDNINVLQKQKQRIEEELAQLASEMKKRAIKKLPN